MPKSVIISGYYGFENFGDDLILKVMLNQLKSSEIQPMVLSGHPEQTSRLYRVESIQRIELHRIWQAMETASAFISGGGGLFQDVTGPASPLYYGGLIEIAHFKKLPVAIFGQGLGPLHSKLGQAMTRRALMHAGLIIVRDTHSRQIVQDFARKPAQLMADPVWSWEPEASLKTIAKERVGISLRNWPQLTTESIRHLANCLADVPEVKAAGLNLIDCQAGADIIPLAKLEQALKEKGVSCQWYSGTNCMNGIAASTMVIAMRYHAVLIAAQLGTPLLTLSYDPKVRDLATQLKLVDHPVDQMQALSGKILSECPRIPDPYQVEALQNASKQGFSILISWLNR